MARHLVHCIRRAGSGEAGSAAVEAVILLPVVVSLLLLVVAVGAVVDVRARATGAARDAARAGSLQRDYPAAVHAAQIAAKAALGGTCDRGLRVEAVSGPAAFTPGGLFTVEVRCSISLASVQLLALPDTVVTTTATAPLDVLHRIQDTP